MKPCRPQLELSLADAQAAIAAQLAPLAAESVPLRLAQGRICAADCLARLSIPSCDQSARDGFAVAAAPLFAEQGFAVFHIAGEIAAGCAAANTLAPGQAFRIMTGAAAPFGTARVLPFEVCQEKDGHVHAPLAELATAQRQIRCQGCEVRSGQVLAAAGTRLLADHLRLLAEDGCEEVAAHRRPRAVVVCTGSELAQAGMPLPTGGKISGNGALLAALLEAQGCVCVRALVARDDADSLAALLTERMEQDQPDLIITTGGMGPGKFDLTEQVFDQLGGEMVCNRLRLRPGRATLFGLLNGRLPFFGLPGPPPAVRLLFHELVMPALARLQGEDMAGGLLRARLDGPPPALQPDCTVLKSAVAWADEEGQLRARPTEGLEPPNAILHLRSGEEGLVSLRLIGPLAAAGSEGRRRQPVRR
ncbi:molybdopterin molybdotransferase MoeA [Candidatus Electronema sp. TJ]|uniref:molybdopterin molybdotransferase MoeA n=1 Tax=Candidatus Electronema sp. TJ TaxID=3401573 RepID=UPI003AA869FE